MQKNLQKMLHESLRQRGRTDVRRNMRGVVATSSKPRAKMRDLQFLRPILVCQLKYGPADQRGFMKISAMVKNIGAGPSYGAVLQLKVDSGGKTTNSQDRILLQSGQSSEHPISIGKILASSKVQLTCFDPLHDPITTKMADDLFATRPNDLLSHPRGPLSNWQEYAGQSDGSFEPVAQATWHAQFGTPPPPSGSPLAGYYASDDASAIKSQLRQSIDLSNHPAAQDVRTGNAWLTLDADYYLQARAKGYCAFEFRGRRGNLIADSLPNHRLNNRPAEKWSYVSASRSVPAGTQSVTVILGANKSRRRGRARGNVFYSAPRLLINRRNIFSCTGARTVLFPKYLRQRVATSPRRPNAR